MAEYVRGMSQNIARRCHDALQPIHAMTYFVPETQEHLEATGLEHGRMCYFAGRSAPMGPVGAGVVAATFYNFNPDLVAAHIPRAWALASPDTVVAARFASADAALQRLLGADAITSAEVAEAAQLAREAAAGCTPEGRPLYAAHADLEWPDKPHLVLWHALSLLREFRGDGHICALVGAELSGLQALVVHTASGHGFVEPFAKASRQWSDEQWSGAVEALRDRNILDGAGELTAHGDAFREQVEAATDRLASAPFDLLGSAGVERLVELGTTLTARIRMAGAFPPGIFAAR